MERMAPNAAGMNPTIFIKGILSGVGAIIGVNPNDTIPPIVDDKDIIVVANTLSFSGNQC